jgi:hypothetical protein
MGIIDDIKNNSIEELHLTNDPDDYFDEANDFADAMKENTSIKTVIFDADFLGSTVAKERAVIVSSVGKLPSVEKVVLKGSLLMVGVCVTNLIKSASKLNDLTLEECTLQGVPSDFEKFKEVLGESESLKALHLNNCHPPHEEVKIDEVVKDLQDGLSIEVTAQAA